MRSIGSLSAMPPASPAATQRVCYFGGEEQGKLSLAGSSSSARVRFPMTATSQRRSVPSLPQSQICSPLSENRSPRAQVARTSQFVSQAGEQKHSLPMLSTRQSGGCHCQEVQSVAVCAALPELFRELRTVITADLRAYCKILVAEQEAAMNHFKVALDERLNSEKDFAKQVQEFEQKLQCLAGGLNNMDLCLAKTASQQESAHAEHQKNHTTAVCQSFEESLQEACKMLQASILQCNARAQQTCRNLVVHGPKDGGDQLHPPSALSYVTPSATGVGAARATEQLPSSSEASNTIEFLETSLASMLEHEHEQIRRLRARIRIFEEHRGCNGAYFGSWSGNSG